MKNFIAANKVFLLLYLIFLIAGGVLLFFFEKGDEILYFDSLHRPILNELFRWITLLAELPAFILVFLLVLFSGYGYGLLLGVNLALNGIAVQLLKHTIFSEQVRPSVFFEGKHLLHFVPGVSIAHQYTFPSGHTTIAFALFFMLSLFLRDKRWSVLFFFAALLIGVSRIYLLQHFFRDVYAGSLLAMILTSAFWLTFATSSFYQNLKWKDKALLK